MVKMRNKFLLLFFIVSFTTAGLAQNNYNLSQFGNESFQFIKQPLKWERNDWLKLGLIGAGTFLAMQADQPIRDVVMKDRSYFKSFPIEAGGIWGETYPTAIFVGAFGLHGLITNNQSSKKIAFEIVQTTFYAGAITTFLKIALGRARPYTSSGSSFYKVFSFGNDDFHSLPSGHATLAFSLSTVLSRNAKTDFLKVLAYVPAVLTAVSRVYQDKHWTSDVLLGAAVGYFVGNWVCDQHETSETNQTVLLSPFSISIPIN